MSYRGRSTFFVIINRFIDSLRPKNLRTHTKHMGSDYLGNKYFEINQQKELFDVRNQPKRWFVPPHEDFWDRPLPPEWNAWLRMSRKDPPTDEEIEYNLMIENQKKEFDRKNKTIKIETKSKESMTGFPILPDYEEKDDKYDK